MQNKNKHAGNGDFNSNPSKGNNIHSTLQIKMNLFVQQQI